MDEVGYLRSFFDSARLQVTDRTGKADGLRGIPTTQSPLTTPLERGDIPPQLSMKLEHFVGQLDLLWFVVETFLNRKLF